MKILKRLFMGILVLTLSCEFAYTASNGKGKGAGNGEGKGRVEQDRGNNGQNQGNNGQSRASQISNARSTLKASNSEKRRKKMERARDQANVRTNRPTSEARGRSAEHRRIKKAKVYPRDVINALGKARWSHNPNDERGQGNRGKVDLRDPYGHDKDSGREGIQRGRPIRELAALLGIDFSFNDPYLIYLQTIIERYQQYSSYSWIVDYYQRLLDSYDSSYYSYYKLALNRTDPIDYNLTFNLQGGFKATDLLVTTTLTSVNNYDYTFYTWTYDPILKKYVMETTTIHYDAGQVIEENTQEVTLVDNNSFSYSADLSTDLASFVGVYAELTVTVTEPVSGQSYTMTLDKQLYLYRCPYGKVTNKKTGQPIVGAKVTVHFEDGSIVPLDKASNPTASNPQRTDATGRYGFKLRTGRKYYITAVVDGYKDYTSEVFTEKWHVLREDVALVPVEGKELALNLE